MNRKIFTKFLTIFAVVITIPWINAFAIDRITKSPDKIEGSDSETNVKFSSVLTGENYVSVVIELNGKKIIAEIDYHHNGGVFLSSIDTSNNLAVIINKKDKELLEEIKNQLPPTVSTPEDALMSTLNVVLEYPDGEPIEYNTLKGSERISTQRATPQALSPSLCDKVGEIVTGKYTVENPIPGKQCKKRTRQVPRGGEYVYYECQESVVVGPCWNKENECMGRCGEGCSDQNETIQRFTQNCLNHDLCTRATGKKTGECLPEMLAAADDYLRAEDCGNVTGQWQDNYSYIWDLKQNSNVGRISGNKISGDVLVQNNFLRCSTWDVSGNHTGQNITLKATNPEPIEAGCCTKFSYKGKADSCNTASGSWDNECGLKGSWIMYRTGSRISVMSTNDSDLSVEVSPASDGRNLSR